jgi:dTDP-4-dehydrorhamnose 3,5-epimerase
MPSPSVSQPLTVLPTRLAGLLLLEPRCFEDARGFFLETYNQDTFAQVGIPTPFVQTNHSYSTQGVLRGLHFQRAPHQMGKLVYCVAGEVMDVAVDIRPDSATFGQWEAVTLSGENRRLFYLPPGFAHGFCVVSETAHILYQCTHTYAPTHDSGIRWDDPDLNITWPCTAPILSEKDQHLQSFRQFVEAQHGT